jgi:hydrogenase nickel insertion protein HypA
MHELATAQKILELAVTKLQALGAAMEAESISMLVGEFRNLDHESLSFAFDSIKAEYYGCAGCQLILTQTPCYALCAGDGHKFHPEASKAFSCPQCGCGMGNIITGQELDIVGITARPSRSKNHAPIG